MKDQVVTQNSTDDDGLSVGLSSSFRFLLTRDHAGQWFFLLFTSIYSFLIIVVADGLKALSGVQHLIDLLVLEPSNKVML